MRGRGGVCSWGRARGERAASASRRSTLLQTQLPASERDRRSAGEAARREQGEGGGGIFVAALFSERLALHGGAKCVSPTQKGADERLVSRAIDAGSKGGGRSAPRRSAPPTKGGAIGGGGLAESWVLQRSAHRPVPGRRTVCRRAAMRGFLARVRELGRQGAGGLRAGAGAGGPRAGGDAAGRAQAWRDVTSHNAKRRVSEASRRPPVGVEASAVGRSNALHPPPSPWRRRLPGFSRLSARFSRPQPHFSPPLSSPPPPRPCRTSLSPLLGLSAPAASPLALLLFPASPRSRRPRARARGSAGGRSAPLPRTRRAQLRRHGAVASPQGGVAVISAARLRRAVLPRPRSRGARSRGLSLRGPHSP